LALDAIRADNVRLNEELAMETKFSVNPTSEAAKKFISRLEAQDKSYEALIQEQQALSESLLDQKVALNTAIEQHRAAMGGINNALEASVRAQRRVILLENRVQQAAGAKSAAELRSAQIRDKVNGLRRERRLFDELANKMERSLVGRAQEVYEVMKKTHEAHNAKSRAESMKAQIREQMAMDVKVAETQWEELTKILGGDRQRRAAEQAQRDAERLKRMDSLLHRQRAVDVLSVTNNRSGRSSSPKGAALAGSTEKKTNKTTTIKSNNNLLYDSSTNNIVEEPTMTVVQRLRAMEERLAAVTSLMEHCGDAVDVAQKFESAKSLCLGLFASLGESQLRVESLEEKLLRVKGELAAGREGDNRQPDSMAEDGYAPALIDGGSRFVVAHDVEDRVKSVCREVLALCQRVR